MKHPPVKLPAREPALRLIARPSDANPKGDIFGGWLMSQIDVAGAIAARTVSNGPISTVAVKSLQFIAPLYAFDLVSFYTEIGRVGTTSIAVKIEVYAQRYLDLDATVHKISDAEFVFVAVSEPGKKRLINMSK